MPKRSVKHAHIHKIIGQEIESGAFADGRLPTEAELCKRFNVSRPTVARALADLGRAGKLARKPGAGTFLTPNSSDQMRIGVLMPGLGHTEILDPIIAALGKASQRHHCSLVMGGSDPLTSDAKQLIDPLLAAHVDGILFAPLELPQERDAINAAIIARCRAEGVPVVLLDRDLAPFPSRSDLDLVAIDHWQAGYVLGSHIASKGRRRLALVGPEHPPTSVELRQAGVREAMARVSGDVILYSATADYAETVKRLLAAGCDAAICINDLIAARLLAALIKRGVAVPKRVQVAGFDDVAYAALLGVPLTTMRQPCDAIASTAISALIDRRQHPESPPHQLLVTAELVKRASTGDR